MEKINTQEFKSILKDVRTSYRLLALYQTRLKDVVKYILDQYQLNFLAGYQKFTSMDSKNGKGAKLERNSWDWLPMYLYQFSAVPLEKNGDNYSFYLFHQADTGFYDIVENEQTLNNLNVANYNMVEDAETRLIFVLSKNDADWPFTKVLKNNLSKQKSLEIVKENWLAKSYNMEHFFNQETAASVIKDFDELCYHHFYIHLLTD